jgi:O-methyltransferase
MRRNRLRLKALKFIKDVSFRTGLLQGSLFPIYPFMYEPHQLEFLLKCVREINSVPGACVEVGCAEGATAVFLKKYLNYLGAKKHYVALDTFAGFVAEDVDYEIESRGKDEALRDEFIINRRAWVVESLRRYGINDVELIQCDAATFDYKRIGDISFCLIDVDLYKPVTAVLPKVYEQLSSGGIIVVDDCQEHPKWDGALEAYQRFVRAHDRPAEIVCGKLGLIRK